MSSVCQMQEKSILCKKGVFTSNPLLLILFGILLKFLKFDKDILKFYQFFAIKTKKQGLKALLLLGFKNWVWWDSNPRPID